MITFLYQPVFYKSVNLALAYVKLPAADAYGLIEGSSEDRGRTVGLITSGIVIGILLARTVAGLLNDWLGWRSVYIFSSALTMLGCIMVFLRLPTHDIAKSKMSYIKSILSVFQLYRELSTLRIRALLAMLIFTAFSIFWTTMVFPLSSSPLSFSHTCYESNNYL